MLVLWMAYATLVSALGAIAAECWMRLSAGRGGGVRWAWLLALACSLTVPVVLATRHQVAGIEIAARDVVVPAERVLPVQVDRTPTERARHRSHIDVDRVVAIAWLLASAALLLVFVSSVVRLGRRMRRWTRATIDGVEVMISDVDGPAVVGMVRPIVVLPAWALAVDSRDRALMLQHELEHLRTHDPLLGRAASIATILAPWNPALWLIARRLRLAIEIDCDTRVLAAGHAAHEYGMLLIAVGGRRKQAPVTAIAFADSARFLEQRLEAMTAASSRRVLSTIALSVALLASTAAMRFVPQPASLRRVTVFSERLPRVEWVHLVTTQPTAASARVPEPRLGTVPPLAITPALGSSQQLSIPFAREFPSGSREVRGRVVDAATNAAIPNAFIEVLGALALNEPNEACSDGQGEFRMRVPDGPTSLSARTTDYDFTRVLVGEADSVVTLRGAKVPSRSDVPSDPITVIERRDSSAAARAFGVQYPHGTLTLRTQSGVVITVPQRERLAIPTVIVDGVALSAEYRGFFQNPCVHAK